MAPAARVPPPQSPSVRSPRSRAPRSPDASRAVAGADLTPASVSPGPPPALSPADPRWLASLFDLRREVEEIAAVTHGARTSPTPIAPPAPPPQRTSPDSSPSKRLSALLQSPSKLRDQNDGSTPSTFAISSDGLESSWGGTGGSYFSVSARDAPFAAQPPALEHINESVTYDNEATFAGDDALRSSWMPLRLSVSTSSPQVPRPVIFSDSDEARGLRENLALGVRAAAAGGAHGRACTPEHLASPDARLRRALAQSPGVNFNASFAALGSPPRVASFSSQMTEGARGSASAALAHPLSVSTRVREDDILLATAAALNGTSAVPAVQSEFDPSWLPSPSRMVPITPALGPGPLMTAVAPDDIDATAPFPIKTLFPDVDTTLPEPADRTHIPAPPSPVDTSSSLFSSSSRPRTAERSHAHAPQTPGYASIEARRTTSSSPALAPAPAPLPLPTGRVLTITCLSSWGDAAWVGLMGLEFFDGAGQRIEFAAPRSSRTISLLGARPSCLALEGDPRASPAALLDHGAGSRLPTADELRSWLAPFGSSAHPPTLRIMFDAAKSLSSLRIWNYNAGGRAHSYRGVRRARIELDGDAIWEGEIRRAPGRLPSAPTAGNWAAPEEAPAVSSCAETVVWTRDEQVLAATLEVDPHARALDAWHARRESLGASPPRAVEDVTSLLSEMEGASHAKSGVESRSAAAAVPARGRVGALIALDLLPRARVVTFTALSNLGDAGLVGLGSLSVLIANETGGGFGRIALAQLPYPARAAWDETDALGGAPALVDVCGPPLTIKVDLGTECAIAGLIIQNFFGSGGEDVLRGVRDAAVFLDGVRVAGSVTLRPADAAARLQAVDFERVVGATRAAARALAAFRAPPRGRPADAVVRSLSKQDFEPFLNVTPTGSLFRFTFSPRVEGPFSVALEALGLYDARGVRIPVFPWQLADVVTTPAASAATSETLAAPVSPRAPVTPAWLPASGLAWGGVTPGAAVDGASHAEALARADDPALYSPLPAGAAQATRARGARAKWSAASAPDTGATLVVAFDTPVSLSLIRLWFAGGGQGLGGTLSLFLDGFPLVQTRLRVPCEPPGGWRAGMARPCLALAFADAAGADGGALSDITNGYLCAGNDVGDGVKFFNDGREILS